MSDSVTQLLLDWSDGDQGALAKLMPLIYDELHRLAELYMQRERADHTLQPTALIHEAYLHLIDQSRVRWQNRSHFFGVAAHLMRRVTLKHAERHRAQKRDGRSAVRVSFDEADVLDVVHSDEILALNQALERLEILDARQGRIVELRFFAGLNSAEIGEVLGISRATIDRDWRVARAWLRRELRSGGDSGRAPD